MSQDDEEAEPNRPNRAVVTEMTGDEAAPEPREPPPRPAMMLVNEWGDVVLVTSVNVRHSRVLAIPPRSVADDCARAWTVRA